MSWRCKIGLHKVSAYDKRDFSIAGSYVYICDACGLLKVYDRTLRKHIWIDPADIDKYE